MKSYRHFLRQMNTWRTKIDNIAPTKANREKISKVVFELECFAFNFSVSTVTPSAFGELQGQALQITF